MTDRALHRVLLVLALAGIGIAAYLTYVHYRGLSPICAIDDGCEKVQSSSYAKVAGVPVPLVGLVGYVAILVSLLVRGEAARLATAGMALGGFAFSVYLTGLELFEINAICQWCVGSAVVMTAIAVLATIRALRAPGDPLVEAGEPYRHLLGPEGEPA
jgi:uncharacterized membrane protein